MERNIQNPQREQDALESATQLARERQLRRERIVIGAWGGVTLVALVAMCMLLEGCGHGSKSTAQSNEVGTSSSEVASAVVASNPVAIPAESNIETTQPQGEFTGDPGLAPPDAIVAVSDTFVTAGQAVEVKVEGTPDVTEMALSDGRGDAIPMVKDASGTWRVGYRVPLRPRTDRLGLAVTAKNEAHRWRRVWVFLQVDDGKQQVENTVPAPDTTSQQ